MGAGHYHFSVDDIAWGTRALLEPRPGATPGCLEILQHWADRFGTRTDLYFFLDSLPPNAEAARQRGCCIPAHLRFAPHASNAQTPPHTQSPDERNTLLQAGYQVVDDYLGGQRAHWLRLHYFSEPLENHVALRAEGVTDILLTDKPALAYRLPQAQRAQLARRGACEYDGLTYRSSHIRLEHLPERVGNRQAIRHYLDQLVDTRSVVVLFTHEEVLATQAIAELGEFCLAHLSQQGLTSL